MTASDGERKLLVVDLKWRAFVVGTGGAVIGKGDENRRRAANVENTRASRVSTWKRHRQLGSRGAAGTRGVRFAAPLSLSFSAPW